MRWIKLIGFLLAVAWCAPSQAACTDDDFIDPINDIVWDCIFPITVMSIPFDYGEHPPDSNNSDITCQCPGTYGPYDPGWGFIVTFWEPARMMDTVTDAGCFPALGTEIDLDNNWGYVGGGTLKRGVANIAFQHFHYYVMPIWGVLDMFTDIPCLSDETTFDLAMISEIRPDWGDDLTAMEIYPETALMANPATVLSCVADAVAATVKRPIDALYWCIGSWGTTYPMTGHITARDYVAANAGIAAKAMYMLGRNGLLHDRAMNYCNATVSPIWQKTHWRLQESDPVADNRCHVIGEPGILWTDRKNPVGKQDNFAWMIFRKVRCCVVVF